MMKKRSVIGLVVLASAQHAFASGADEVMLERKRTLSQMQYKSEQLELQASMAKSIKEMVEAGFIVDENGTPMGVGDMELLALRVLQQGGKESSNKPFNANDPFGGMNPVMPMPPPVDGMFANGAFRTAESMRAPKPAEPEKSAVEVVTKPTASEKAQGKQVLALAEVRGNSAIFFTNEGFEEVRLGGKVYDMRLKEIGIDNVVVTGPNGERVIRIDWTKSVRYSDD